MNYLQDGAYDAHLVAARYGLSRLGKPIVEFLWKIDSSDLTVKSFLHLEMKNGLRNVRGIQFTQVWASDWNGTDPEWFEKNIELCSRYPVRLTVVNVESPNEPGRLYTQVKWVNARLSHPVPAKAPDEGGLRRIDPARAAELPDPIVPSMKGAWQAFCFLTSDWTAAERENLWFALVGKVAPGKDQIDFTEAEWSRIINEMKGTNDNES